MMPELENYTHGAVALMGTQTMEVRSRKIAKRRPWIAGMKRARCVAGLVLITASLAGCAMSNYDFDALSEVSNHSRGAHLSEGLALEEKHERLYDVSALPLVHTHLNIFSESEDEGYPNGYVETDFDAYLPFFGFVDATINRYDSDQEMYEHNEYKSYLWGLIQSHKEQINTKLGLREKRVRTFLWFFDWKSSPEYIDS